jgi:hypothetical protein
MPFLYAIMVGVILGFANLSLFESILIIIGLISFNSLKDIIFKKGFMTGILSPYQLYLENLAGLNKSLNNAAIKYFFKSLLTDGIISTIVFLLIRVIF